MAEAKKLNNNPTLQVSFLLYLILPTYFLLSLDKKKERNFISLLNANRKQLRVKSNQNFKRKITFRLVKYECIQVSSCEGNVNVKHYSVR